MDSSGTTFCHKIIKINQIRRKDLNRGHKSFFGVFMNECLTYRKLVMAIIWYLGCGRHENDLRPPALFLDNIIVRHDVENEAYDEPSDNEV